MYVELLYSLMSYWKSSFWYFFSIINILEWFPTYIKSELFSQRKEMCAMHNPMLWRYFTKFQNYKRNYEKIFKSKKDIDGQLYLLNF